MQFAPFRWESEIVLGGVGLDQRRQFLGCAAGSSGSGTATLIASLLWAPCFAPNLRHIACVRVKLFVAPSALQCRRVLGDPLCLVGSVFPVLWAGSSAQRLRPFRQRHLSSGVHSPDEEPLHADAGMSAWVGALVLQCLSPALAVRPTLRAHRQAAMCPNFMTQSSRAFHPLERLFTLRTPVAPNAAHTIDLPHCCMLGVASYD